MCWRQAANFRPANKALDPAAASRYGQQLFIANLRLTARNRPAPPPEPVLAWPHRPVDHQQLVMFDIRPDLSRGRRVVPPPRDLVLAEALDRHAIGYAARHGWNRFYLTRIRSSIRILLGLQHTPGAAITTSEAAILTEVWLPVRDVLAVLAAVRMHHDDRPPTVERWFERQLTGLPDPMVNELRIWFDLMCHGSSTPPRRRPRSETTIRVYLGRLLPTLHTWAAAGHSSLREISRDDIVVALPADSSQRSHMGQALRSLFGILKARAIFANPTARISTWTDTPLQVPPVDLDQIRAALHSPNPARAVLAALVAFHGLRSGQLRSLLLTDIHDARLHLSDRTVPLAPPVLERLAAWLDYRQHRWPQATNAHLFITMRSAHRDEPVSYRWIGLTLDIPGNVTALRGDRIRDEADATQGDIRRLCDLFGISVSAATRYANTLDHPDLRSL